MSKSKQPAFRADYVAKLKELGVYDQFIKNWQNDAVVTDIELANEQETFLFFVRCAFFFHRTPEGFDFWYKISES